MYGYSFGGMIAAKMFKLYLSQILPKGAEIEIGKRNKYGIVNVWYTCDNPALIESAADMGKILNEKLYGI